MTNTTKAKNASTHTWSTPAEFWATLTKLAGEVDYRSDLFWDAACLIRYVEQNMSEKRNGMLFEHPVHVIAKRLTEETLTLPTIWYGWSESGTHFFSEDKYAKPLELLNPYCTDIVKVTFQVHERRTDIPTYTVTRVKRNGKEV